MASQPAVRTQHGGPLSPPPVTRKPRAERTFTYEKRLSLNKIEDFEVFIQGYPDKRGIQLYIYRLLPKIDLGLIGVKEHTIHKAYEPDEMTADFVGRKFGRGRYQFKLNDKLKDKGERERCEVNFDIDDPKYPEPIYDRRTLLLGAKDNVDEINRLIMTGELVRGVDGQPRIRTASDGPPRKEETVTSGAASPVGNDLVNQIVLQALKSTQTNPKEQFEQIIQTAKLLQPSQAPGVSIDEIVERVVSKLLPQLGPQRAAANPFAEWERIETFLQKVRAGQPVIAAATDGGQVSDNEVSKWTGLVTAVKGLIPEVIQGYEYLQQQRRAARPPANVVANRPPQRAQYAQQPQQQTFDGQQPQFTQDDEMRAQAIARVAETCIQKMQEGADGFHVAAYVCNFDPEGLEVFRLLEAKGTDAVMGMLTMNPQTSPMMRDPATREKTEKFLDEFFSYDPDAEGKSGEGDAPAAKAS